MLSWRAWIAYRLVRRAVARARTLRNDIPAMRAASDSQADRMRRMPPGVRSEAASVGSLPGEWLRPDSPDASLRGGVVLYLHGGAYLSGSVKTHRGLAAHLAVATGAPVFVLSYRLAPEHPFPAALDDAAAAYHALREAHPRCPVALAGDSAGGGLAMALLIRLRRDSAVLPAGAVLMSPWVDLTLAGETHRTRASVDPFFPDTSLLRGAAVAYARGHALDDALVSPVFATPADLSGLPPVLIHVGDREALLDDARQLAQRLQAAGVQATCEVHPHLWHVWQAFAARVPEANRSVRELGLFLARRLSA